MGAADPFPLRSLLLFCSQCERGDGTGDEDHRRQEMEGDECPESAGGRKKKPRLKKPKENHFFITDFGEKISLFLPGFEAGEMTAELVDEGRETPVLGPRSAGFCPFSPSFFHPKGVGDGARWRRPLGWQEPFFTRDV